MVNRYQLLIREEAATTFTAGEAAKGAAESCEMTHADIRQHPPYGLRIREGRVLSAVTWSQYFSPILSVHI